MQAPLGDALTDEELERLALSADPDQRIDPDAVPIDVYLATDAGPLPQWYMPAVTARHSSRRRRAVVIGLIAAFVLIEAFGLCSTYGQLPFH
jgi:hypothetical protein